VIDVQVSVIIGEPSPAQLRAWVALWRLLLVEPEHTNALEAPTPRALDGRGAISPEAPSVEVRHDA
jgi:hypothetical protein